MKSAALITGKPAGSKQPIDTGLGNPLQLLDAGLRNAAVNQALGQHPDARGVAYPRDEHEALEALEVFVRAIGDADAAVLHARLALQISRSSRRSAHWNDTIKEAMENRLPRIQ